MVDNLLIDKYNESDFLSEAKRCCIIIQRYSFSFPFIWAFNDRLKRLKCFAAGRNGFNRDFRIRKKFSRSVEGYTCGTEMHVWRGKLCSWSKKCLQFAKGLWTSISASRSFTLSVDKINFCIVRHNILISIFFSPELHFILSL